MKVKREVTKEEKGKEVRTGVPGKGKSLGKGQCTEAMESRACLWHVSGGSSRVGGRSGKGPQSCVSVNHEGPCGFSGW